VLAGGFPQDPCPRAGGTTKVPTRMENIRLIGAQAPCHKEPATRHTPAPAALNGRSDRFLSGEEIAARPESRSSAWFGGGESRRRPVLSAAASTAGRTLFAVVLEEEGWANCRGGAAGQRDERGRQGREPHATERALGTEDMREMGPRMKKSHGHRQEPRMERATGPARQPRGGRVAPPRVEFRRPPFAEWRDPVDTIRLDSGPIASGKPRSWQQNATRTTGRRSRGRRSRDR